MLVLSRKPGETLNIGTDVTIKILDCGGSRVRIGIEAPGHVAVLRGELLSLAGSAGANAARRAALFKKG